MPAISGSSEMLFEASIWLLYMIESSSVLLSITKTLFLQILKDLLILKWKLWQHCAIRKCSSTWNPSRTLSEFWIQTFINTMTSQQEGCWYYSLCPESPSLRGFDTSSPVCLLFKSIKHNAFYPVWSAQFICCVAARMELGKMHWVLWIFTKGEQVKTSQNIAH